ncbi:MAG: copper homeostasis protein CutC [Bacteroidia bacterium]|jgi:copper homeostasis protein
MSACLEIACFSAEALLIAAKAGAHRLEYCASYAEGGVTPISGTLLPIRQQIACPVRVMIRCRGGGFVYSHGELLDMRQQLRRWADEGVDGWVVGCLTPDRLPDADAILSIAQAAPSLPFTFHRAFDHCSDPISALHQLLALGCSHLLSSGTPTGGALDGIEKLIIYAKHLNGENQKLKPEQPNKPDQLKLMVGGGVRRDNISTLFGQFGDMVDYHSAAVVAGLGRHPSTDPNPDPNPDPSDIEFMLCSLL